MNSLETTGWLSVTLIGRHTKQQGIGKSVDLLGLILIGMSS